MKVLNLIKNNVYIIAILILGSFLRLYRLDELMPFIGDQVLFYLPARDMLIEGVIPLVGPQTSHPWIHHGAHWTYVLAIILWVFNFNPVPPAYFIAILGVLTVWLLYKVSSELFSKRIGLIAAFLFATSPLIILNSRMPYHTSPIPFFTILLFFAVYKWIKGNVYYFPLITFLMAVLYNHELTTSVLSISIFFIAAYGFWKSKKWSKELLNKKIILYSVLTFLIPMMPFILYDINHGYKQTIGFLVWVVYRLFKFPLSILDSSKETFHIGNSLVESSSYLGKLIFAPSVLFSLAILIFSVAYFFYLMYRKMKSKDVEIGYVLLLLYLIIPIFGLFMHRAPIEADILLISPFFILVVAVLFDRLFSIGFLKVAVITGIGIIGLLNSSYLLLTEYLTKIGSGSRISFRERVEAVNSVIKIAAGRQYNLVGRGELSDFPMFTMNYEYLLWWRRHPLTKENLDLKIVVWEKSGDIVVYEEKEQ